MGAIGTKVVSNQQSVDIYRSGLKSLGLQISSFLRNEGLVYTIRVGDIKYHCSEKKLQDRGVQIGALQTELNSEEGLSVESKAKIAAAFKAKCDSGKAYKPARLLSAMVNANPSQIDEVVGILREMDLSDRAKILSALARGSAKDARTGETVRCGNAEDAARILVEMVQKSPTDQNQTDKIINILCQMDSEQADAVLSAMIKKRSIRSITDRVNEMQEGIIQDTTSITNQMVDVLSAMIQRGQTEQVVNILSKMYPEQADAVLSYLKKGCLITDQVETIETVVVSRRNSDTTGNNLIVIGQGQQVSGFKMIKQDDDAPGQSQEARPTSVIKQLQNAIKSKKEVIDLVSMIFQKVNAEDIGNVLSEMVNANPPQTDQAVTFLAKMKPEDVGRVFESLNTQLKQGVIVAVFEKMKPAFKAEILTTMVVGKRQDIANELSSLQGDYNNDLLNAVGNILFAMVKENQIDQAAEILSEMQSENAGKILNNMAQFDYFKECAEILDKVKQQNDNTCLASDIFDQLIIGHGAKILCAMVEIDKTESAVRIISKMEKGCLRELLSKMTEYVYDLEGKKTTNAQAVGKIFVAMNSKVEGNLIVDVLGLDEHLAANVMFAMDPAKAGDMLANIEEECRCRILSAMISANKTLGQVSDVFTAMAKTKDHNIVNTAVSMLRSVDDSLKGGILDSMKRRGHASEANELEYHLLSLILSEEKQQQLENIATEMLNKFDDACLVNVLVSMSEIQRDNMLVVMNDCDSTRANTLSGEVYDFIDASNKGAKAAADDCARMESFDVANRFVMILQGSDEGASFVADVVKSLQPGQAAAILNDIVNNATNGDVVVAEILAMVGDSDFNAVINIIGEMAKTNNKIAGKVCDAIYSGFPEVCVEILYDIGIDNAVLVLNNMSTDNVYNILITMEFNDIVLVCSKMDDGVISDVLAKVANGVENGIYVVGDILIGLEPEKADGIVQNIIKLDQTLGNNINDNLKQLRTEQ